MVPENSAVACLTRARSLVNDWRREHGPDKGNPVEHVLKYEFFENILVD